MTIIYIRHNTTIRHHQGSESHLEKSRRGLGYFNARTLALGMYLCWFLLKSGVKVDKCESMDLVSLIFFLTIGFYYLKAKLLVENVKIFQEYIPLIMTKVRMMSPDLVTRKRIMRCCMTMGMRTPLSKRTTWRTRTPTRRRRSTWTVSLITLVTPNRTSGVSMSIKEKLSKVIPSVLKAIRDPEGKLSREEKNFNKIKHSLKRKTRIM